MDINNVNALFARGAVYNMLGNYQKAIDDYSLALEMDSKRKTVYINLGKFLGLNNNDYPESDKTISRDEQSSYMNSSKNIDNIVLDGDINRYVYNHFKDLALKNVSGNLNVNLLQMSSSNNNPKSEFTEENLLNSPIKSSAKEEKSSISGADYLRMNYMNNNKLSNTGDKINKSKVLFSNTAERKQPVSITESSNRESNNQNTNINSQSNKKNTNINSFNNNYMNKNNEKNRIAPYSENFPNQEKFVNSNNQTTSRDLPSSNINDEVNAETKKEKKKNLEKWEVFHAQGYAARKKENYELAIDLYTNALVINPRYFKALFNRGFAFDKIGDYDKAVLDYTKAIEVEPNNAYAYYNRAISFDKKGELERTLEDFTTAIKLLPTKIDFYLNRAYAYRKIKDYEDAIKDYTEVIRLDNKYNKVITLFFI
jgi:tetratricopeptide (TPR) repeat protein